MSHPAEFSYSQFWEHLHSIWPKHLTSLWFFVQYNSGSFSPIVFSISYGFLISYSCCSFWRFSPYSFNCSYFRFLLTSSRSSWSGFLLSPFICCILRVFITSISLSRSRVLFSSSSCYCWRVLNSSFSCYCLEVLLSSKSLAACRPKGTKYESPPSLWISPGFHLTL